MPTKPVLYLVYYSQPCRAVLLTAAALGLELEVKEVDLLGSENLQPEFLEINPQHTIPFLDDNGVHVVDSHAICAYLSEKYGANDKLYPKDLVKRSIVDARLHFDSGHLFCRTRFLFEPVIYHKSPESPQWKLAYIRSQWEILEGFLQKSNYLAGDELTIADFCAVATVSSIDEIVPIDAQKYPKLTQWIKRLSQLPYYKEKNGVGARAFQNLFRATLQKNIDALQ